MTYGAEVHHHYTERHPRLVIYNRRLEGGTELLMEDGTWSTFGEGVLPPNTVGLPMPSEALEAVYRAIAAHLGNTLPSVAEVAVLREVLAKEQARVDAVLERWLPS